MAQSLLLGVASRTGLRRTAHRGKGVELWHYEGGTFKKLERDGGDDDGDRPRLSEPGVAVGAATADGRLVGVDPTQAGSIDAEFHLSQDSGSA